MKRLTKKSGIGYIPRHMFKDENAVLNDIELSQAYDQAIDKLGKLEDIEEEIGIDLIKLFEIYKKLLDLKSLWYKGEVSGYEYINVPKYNQVVIDFEEMSLLILDYGEVVFIFHFKDYGKTWALTKEELEENK